MKLTPETPGVSIQCRSQSAAAQLVTLGAQRYVLDAAAARVSNVPSSVFLLFVLGVFYFGFRPSHPLEVRTLCISLD
jgi:hypothetical protein